MILHRTMGSHFSIGSTCLQFNVSAVGIGQGWLILPLATQVMLTCTSTKSVINANGLG